MTAPPDPATLRRLAHVIAERAPHTGERREIARQLEAAAAMAERHTAEVAALNRHIEDIGEAQDRAESNEKEWRQTYLDAWGTKDQEIDQLTTERDAARADLDRLRIDFATLEGIRQREAKAAVAWETKCDAARAEVDQLRARVAELEDRRTDDIRDAFESGFSIGLERGHDTAQVRCEVTDETIRDDLAVRDRAFREHMAGIAETASCTEADRLRSDLASMRPVLDAVTAWYLRTPNTFGHIVPEDLRVAMEALAAKARGK